MLLDQSEVQRALAAHVRRKRKHHKLSRAALAERSGVPASTIKRFELTGEISLRQLLLLWQCVDDLNRIQQLTKASPAMPTSIDEVLNDEF